MAKTNNLAQQFVWTGGPIAKNNSLAQKFVPTGGAHGAHGAHSMANEDLGITMAART